MLRNKRHELAVTAYAGASIIAMLGIGLFALPAGILADGFSEEVHRKDGTATCPHCGERIAGAADSSRDG